MGDSQYWTSLWGVGLILALVVLCVSLGVAVFILFHDRIGALGIWDSQIWHKVRIPLIILGVIASLAAAIALNHASRQRELKAVQDYAQALGWGFSRKAEEDLDAEVAAILADLRLYLFYIRTVETGPRNLCLFDCSYSDRNASASSRNSRGTACLVQSDRFRDSLVPVTIFPRDWSEVMQSDKVDMGESPFAREFLVQSKDSDSAGRVVNRAIQAILMEHLHKPLHNPVTITIGPGGAVVFTERTAEPERLEDLLDLARRLESTAD